MLNVQENQFMSPESENQHGKNKRPPRGFFPPGGTLLVSLFSVVNEQDK